MWDAYERHWDHFSTDNSAYLTADQIPFPIDNYTFVFHMRRILESKGDMSQIKNSKKQWEK